MQTLTAPPRDALTAAQVTALLTGPVQVAAGCERLTAALAVAEDISNDLLGGQVSRGMNDLIHGTVRLELSRPLTWGVDLVRPYMLLSNGPVTARFNCGVFLLTTPDRTVGENPETYSVAGFDRLVLLNRQVGADYSVTVGTTYRAALLQAFTDAGLSGVLIDGSAADSSLPSTKTWPLIADSTNPDQTTTPVTWLRVVNDLLTAINFRGVWADENGLFRCSAYQPPTARAAEFTFDADSALTIVGESRTYSQDVWAVPNRWVFRQTNRPSGSPTPTEGDGIYTVNNTADGPTSQTIRGLVWASVIDYEAASQAALVGLGDRRVAADRRVTAQIKATTGPFPLAGHADVFGYSDTALGAFKVQATAWQLDLTGADTSWTWELVT